MELFGRRYLCFIAFIFVFSAFVCCFVSGVTKIVMASVALVLLSVFAFVFIKVKKTRFYSLFAMLLCSAVFVSALSSYVFITRAEEEADSVVGENVVMLKIISKEYDDQYNVRLLKIGDKEVSMRATFVVDVEENFEYADELIVRANVRKSTNIFDRSILLTVFAQTEDVGVYLNRAEEKDYFSFDGIRALCGSLQDSFGDFVDNAFGDYGGMVKGLLVNDKSDIDDKTNLDFRRSGTLHILAVSGMHITLLMGALELLLRKISVKREIRIVFVSIFALLFLVLTAFAVSAVRSVIMLYAVYLTYLLSEENDSITALFVSIAVIILLSPYAVYDLGLWMSFLATLGILVAYPQFDRLMPYPKQKNLFVRYSLRFLIACLKAIMLTVVANFFLLPVMWFFFGEISISAVPCNLILGPVVTALMPLCAVATILSFVPYLGAGLIWTTKRLIDVMMAVVEYFSEMRFGVVSLRYAFAGILITLFSAVMIVLLVIKIKRKILIFAPMLAFAITFTCCFSVFSATAEAEIKYLKMGKSEFVFVNKGAECSVVSVNGGDVYDAFDVIDNVSKYATEIDNYFIINPSYVDGITIDKMMKSTVVRNIYIPKDVNYKELLSFENVFLCAEKYNINIEFYDRNEIVEIYNDVSFSEIGDDKVAIVSDGAYLEIVDDKMFYAYDDVKREIYKLDNICVTLPL